MCTLTVSSMVDLIQGHVGQCAICLARCPTWWRGRDFYACVHDGCVDALASWAPTLVTRGEASSVANDRYRRGAYARRGGLSRGVTLFIPSRFPVPGSGWLVLAETNIGHLSTPCGGDAG